LYLFVGQDRGLEERYQTGLLLLQFGDGLFQARFALQEHLLGNLATEVDVEQPLELCPVAGNQILHDGQSLF
jgi:hypothetical protein